MELAVLLIKNAQVVKAIENVNKQNAF